MRAILAGGGTGGHVIPALAIAQEICRRSGEVLFVGTARGIENRLVPAAGFELRLITIGALKNVSIATRLKTMFALPRAVLDARRLIREFRPDVVIGVGGYASGPTMLAAALTGVPAMAFEPNVVPGLANRLIARWTSAAAVHFEQTCRYFRNCRVTGVPVRTAFFDVAPRSHADRPALLVFGGSQGAHAINAAMTTALPSLAAQLPGLHIVHQTGERDLAETQAAYSGAGVDADVRPFINEMPQAFAGADLLLCRSGASTVAEITASGRPAVFVPFPQAADDHQTRNAEALANAGAAVLLPQSQLTPERLAETLISLFTDRTRLAQMGEAARKLAHPNAAAEIVEMAEQIAKP